MDCFDFVRGQGLVGDYVVEAVLHSATTASRFEGAVGDGHVAFRFPEGQRGVCDVPKAEELGRGGGAEVGRVGGWGADYDWFRHFGGTDAVERWGLQ